MEANFGAVILMETFFVRLFPIGRNRLGFRVSC